MAFVVVRLAGHGATVRQLQIALRAFQHLNRWLFVHGEHDGVFRECQVKPDDLGGLGRKGRIVADALGFVGAQGAPDILNMKGSFAEGAESCT